LELDPSRRLKGKRPYLRTAVDINHRNAIMHARREIKKAHKV
jgi:hypothetical protein